MATMTPNSFDPLKRYVNVRMQQGVPIVDADLNELDDVRKFELRAFLKWFVGDGVPEGNDGFHVGSVNPAADNDFIIGVGMPGPPGGAPPTEIGLRNVGRLVLDGLDVMITADTRFTDQPLHENKAGAAALAAKWGVPVVTKLGSPTADAQLVVFLDMWERPVTADEAPELVRAGLGVESCSRVKREWVVRVKAAMPTPGESQPGHAYYQLATLIRRNGVATVAQQDIVDRRERRLLMPPAHLLADTLGVNGTLDTAGYRRGAGRPAVSLRDAINSLLAGRLPTTPDLSVSEGPGLDGLRRGVLVDGADGLVVVWQAPRGTGNSSQIMAARLDVNRPDLGFQAKAVAGGSSATDNRLEPSAVALPDQGILLTYQTAATGGSASDVVMKRAGTFAALSTGGAETFISSTSGASDDSPLAVVAGDQVVFFVYQQLSANPRWFFRRYKYTPPESFPDAAGPVQLSTVTTTTRDLHAAAAGTFVWVAYGDGTNLQLSRLNPSGATATTDMPLTIPGIAPPGGGASFAPFVVGISPTEALVFYTDLVNAPVGLRMVAFSGGSWGSPTVIPGTDGTESNAAAVRDADGNVFLFSGRTIAGASGEIVLRRRTSATGEWGTAQRVSPNAANELGPHAISVPGQGVWAFWISNRSTTGTNFDVYAKRIITAI